MRASGTHLKKQKKRIKINYPWQPRLCAGGNELKKQKKSYRSYRNAISLL
jgi:hypothetical protein